MKDFASYGGGSEEWVDEARKLMEEYGGKSESDLIKAIYARAVEGKQNGTLTNAQIDAFYAQFSPLLDSAKRKKLQRLVEQLKRM